MAARLCRYVCAFCNFSLDLSHFLNPANIHKHACAYIWLKKFVLLINVFCVLRAVGKHGTRTTITASRHWTFCMQAAWAYSQTPQCALSGDHSKENKPLQKAKSAVLRECARRHNTIKTKTVDRRSHWPCLPPVMRNRKRNNRSRSNINLQLHLHLVLLLPKSRRRSQHNQNQKRNRKNPSVMRRRNKRSNINLYLHHFICIWSSSCFCYCYCSTTFATVEPPSASLLRRPENCRNVVGAGRRPLRQQRGRCATLRSYGLPILHRSTDGSAVRSDAKVSVFGENHLVREQSQGWGIIIGMLGLL